MSATRTIVVLVLVAFGLTVAPIAVSAAANGQVSNESTPEADEESETNVTVSSFMQSSAADAENTVESGLFEVRYENADDDDRAEIVGDRTGDLEAKLEALETERNELREKRDELTPPEYNARMAKLAVEIASLDRALERTVPRAADAGVDQDRLDELQNNASELTGPEVATMAQQIAGFERTGVNAAGGQNESTPGQNQTPGLENDQSAPGQDDGQQVPNQSNDLAPSDRSDRAPAEQNRSAGNGSGSNDDTDQPNDGGSAATGEADDGPGQSDGEPGR
ncbi:hypothetical protein [Natrarchaeobius oligotrophus]|uniref:Uncharacterized protein n=1 Tax=Natrarchaeobius chitinivorans TaxID=1679083 RepID=A0A3N6PFJ2_NATCH|nr:hypothetical protein [Natrarchaeobius chitinivorans]RQG98829.1 hypothetical protein EA472_16570 [Natrarchaeobius chitinivorans]